MKVLKFKYQDADTFIYAKDIIKYVSIDNSKTRVFCNSSFDKEGYELDVSAEELLKLIHTKDVEELQIIGIPFSDGV
jgi:hypothetical protein